MKVSQIAEFERRGKMMDEEQVPCARCGVLMNADEVWYDDDGNPLCAQDWEIQRQRELRESEEPGNNSQRK